MATRTLRAVLEVTIRDDLTPTGGGDKLPPIVERYLKHKLVEPADRAQTELWAITDVTLEKP